jgi:proteasome lid subunit RPN8/RPN11
VQRELVLAEGLWPQLLRGLAERGKGERESGAFLLGAADDERAEVQSIVFYDDLDPHCLTGGISFASEGYGRLWDVCEAQGLKVVADAHTHPGSWVQQSDLDRTHPMISMAGHVALIFPNFARGDVTPREIGVHDYLGNGKWRTALGAEAAARIRLASPPRRRWWQLWHQ